MILRKPYAFLIKYFQKINILLLLLVGYVFYKDLQIYKFVKEYLATSVYNPTIDSISNYANFTIYLAFILVIIISIILFISFLIDNILTFTIMNSLKSKLANVRQDSTSDIDKQVREILSKHTFYINKLFKSFPKVKFSFPFGEQLMNSIRETLDNMNTKKKERKKRIKELKHELKKESKK